ncbi:hypothetical protein XI06_22880 [Bradyrhizobium sp. CCBAU 11434]|nr:hypothetical protein [Bradyrhizobium sp. CCBAU 11434]
MRHVFRRNAPSLRILLAEPPHIKDDTHGGSDRSGPSGIVLTRIVDAFAPNVFLVVMRKK